MWQWIRFRATLEESGEEVTLELVRRLVAEVVEEQGGRKEVSRGLERQKQEQ